MGSVLSRVVRVLVSLFFRAWFALTFVSMILVTSPVLHVGNALGALFGISASRRSSCSAAFSGFAFHIFLLLNPQIRIENMNDEPLPWDEMFAPGKPLPFLIINHTSQLDAFVFSASLPVNVIWKMRTMAKSSLFNTPLFGSVLKYCGHFPVYFQSSKVGDFSLDREAQAKVMERIKAHIANGGGLSLYPEGQINRGDTPLLQDFRRGSLQLARDNNMEMWGYLHAGIEDAWPPKALIGGFPCVIKLKLFKFPEISKDLDIIAFTNTIQAIMQKELELMYPSFDYEKAKLTREAEKLAKKTAEEEKKRKEGELGNSSSREDGTKSKIIRQDEHTKAESKMMPFISPNVLNLFHTTNTKLEFAHLQATAQRSVLCLYSKQCEILPGTGSPTKQHLHLLLLLHGMMDLAGFYEALVDHKDLHAALGELMVLTNQHQRRRRETGQAQMHDDILEDCERKLRASISKDAEAICLDCMARVKVGDLSTFETALSKVGELCDMLINLEEIRRNLEGSRNNKAAAAASAASTEVVELPAITKRILELVKKQLAVRCKLAQDELKRHINLQKAATGLGKIETDGKEPYLKAMGTILQSTHESVETATRNELYLSLTEPEFQSATRAEILQIDSIGAKDLVLVFDLFRRDKKMDHFLLRAEELGGLTLPRALKQDSVPSRGATPPTSIKDTKKELQPLSDEELKGLATLLDELSLLLQFCEKYTQFVTGFLGGAAGVRLLDRSMDEKTVAFQSNYLKLEELWLTQTLTIAVVRSEVLSLSDDGNIQIHSLVEDTFDMVNTAFSRAVNTGNISTAAAMANQAVGYLSDGFLSVLQDLVKRAWSEPAVKSGAGESDELMEAMTRAMTGATPVSTGCLIVLNSLEQSLSSVLNLRRVMEETFADRFPSSNLITMATSILVETFAHQRGMYAKFIEDIVAKCITPLQFELMNSTFRSKSSGTDSTGETMSRLEPGKISYDLTNSMFDQYQRENPFGTRLVAQLIVKNAALLTCRKGLTHGNFGFIVERDAFHVANHFERCLNAMSFNELGALQFQQDLRLFIDAFCSLIPSSISLFVVPQSIVDASSVAKHNQDASFERNMHSSFARLRQWSFLLKLECAEDLLKIQYPAPVLNSGEVRNVLSHRVEKNLFSDLNKINVSKHSVSQATN